MRWAPWPRLAGRSPWTLLALPALVVLGLTVPAGSAVLAAGGASGAGQVVTPVDGRLRGPDFAAMVASVAWPDRYDFAGKSEEPPPGHRFVVFDLSLSESTSVLQPAPAQPPVTAAVQWGRTSLALTMTSLNNQITATAPSTGWGTGFSNFVATVANNTHDVDLVLTEGSFSQSFNLWSLQRNAPDPTVLYRDPSFPTLSGTAAGSASIGLSNPSDGFTTSDTLTLQSATLSDFAPAGDAVAPTSPAQAVLSVVLDGEHPDNPDDLTDSGHYLGAQSPLPASMLTFTPAGGSAIAATLSDSGDTTGKGNADDGLFDATYSFVVPASMTTGSVTVAAGSFNGAEYTLFTPEQGNTTLNVTAPATLALSFPAVPAPVIQKAPPWVGAPLPPTAAAASSGSDSTPGPGHNQSFPIWAAVLALVVVAALVVLVQRRRQRSALASATQTEPTSEAPSPDQIVPTVRVPAPPVVAPALAAQPIAAPVAEGSALRINLVGPLDIVDRRPDEVRRILVELLLYLACHDHRHLRVGQIQIGFRPLSSTHAEMAEKTLRNYLSELRQWVGPEHLPESSAKEGYLLQAVDTDWAEIERLCRQADASGGAEAVTLRTAALALVRGRPFEGLLHDGFEWVEANTSTPTWRT